jgi:hypothetical protein
MLQQTLNATRSSRPRGQKGGFSWLSTTKQSYDALLPSALRLAWRCLGPPFASKAPKQTGQKSDLGHAASRNQLIYAERHDPPGSRDGDEVAM